MLRRALMICLMLTTACGSVGNGPLKTDAGGGVGGAQGTGGVTGGMGGAPADAAADLPVGTGGASGTGGAGAGGAAGGAADAAADRVTADAGSDAGDAGPPPVSCQAIKQQTPGATSGIYVIAPLGTRQSVFCEMTSGGGGWTAFYVGDNGSAPGGAHFESAADACPDPANVCLRRLPSTFDVTREFAVKCGASVVKFNLEAMALDYFKNGLQHGWVSLANALAIDVGLVGKANLVATLWTGGTTTNFGWIVAGPDGPASTPAAAMTTFANSYTPNPNWNFCNGAADATSRVMLLYR